MKKELHVVGVVMLAWLVGIGVGAAVSTLSAQTLTYPQVNGNQLVSDTANWIYQKGTALLTMPAASTTTGRNISGAALVERSSRWSVVSFPAANSQGTASLAAEAGVRHVADCVSWAADASAAVTAAAGNVALRDGATGAGTVIGQWAIAHTVAAAAGIQTVVPHSICGLNLVGTTNTAMTLEFNAGVTGEVQSATITGFNIN